MSGSGLAPWASQPNPRENAKILARSLGCTTEDSRTVLRCLQVNQFYGGKSILADSVYLMVLNIKK